MIVRIVSEILDKDPPGDLPFLAEEEHHRVRELIRRYWGFASLRPLQESAIAAALRRRDSLTVLPTGGGKSLCYQVPPLFANRTDIVVSPLISLMKDQVDGLRACGYPAAAFHSGLTSSERAELERELIAGKSRLIFAAPERLFTDSFLRLLSRLNGCTFAIDEAHCISHWGHDFRPEYRRLVELRERFPNASFHAFTATATERVRRDIASQLRLRDPTMLVGSFDRPNLIYRVFPRVDLHVQVLEVIRRHANAAMIIYCLSRRDTEGLADFLRANKVSALAYHAGLDAQTRRRVQDAFAAEEIDVVVATVAFGMGIDRGNVRCVIHASMPKSIEHYQQETGRAGRDGLPAECVLFYSAEDAMRWTSLIEKSARDAERPAEVIAAMTELLEHMRRFSRSVGCRHRMLVEYFGQTYEGANCGACDVCLDEVEALADATIVAQKIISCVARVEERFGVMHVVDVLLGADTDSIRRSGHDKLSTYGLLSNTGRKSLIDLVFQLVDQGLLVRTSGELPVLQLNEASWEVLRKQRTVKLRPPKAKVVSIASIERDDWAGVDRALFEHLRGVRKRIAEQQSVPAFVIFGDVTLRQMARVRPSTIELFGDLYGVGRRKRERLGEVFVKEIAGFCREHGLSTDVAETADADVPTPREMPRQRSGIFRDACKYFEQGRTVEDVMQLLGRARRTVVEYLAQYIETTRPPRLDTWVDAERYRQVSDAASHVGGTRLKPIFERLGGKIPYDIIRLVVAHQKGLGFN